MRNDIVEATRQLALLCRMQVPLSEGLQRMAKEPAASRWLRAIGDDVAKGDRLATAVGRHPNVFSPFYKALVEAAEASEKPGGILTSLSQWLEEAERAAASVRNALFYPLLVIDVLLIELIFFVAAIIPQMLLPLAQSTGGSTSLLHMLSDTPIAIAALGIVLIAINVGVWMPQSSAVLVRLPLVGPLMRTASQALWARALGTLLGAGIELPRALSLSRRVVLDAALLPRLDAVEEEVRRGGTLSDALVGQPDLEPRLAWSTAVGEQDEDLAALLMDAADALDAQVRRQTQHHVRRLEPWVLLAAGILVLFGLASFWWPFYAIVSDIR